MPRRCRSRPRPCRTGYCFPQLRGPRQEGPGQTTTPLLPDEAITISAAVDAFTRGVAYVNHEEDVAGPLEPGKLADIAVLTQDIYAVPPIAIGDTSVALTVASGQIVHGDE